MRLLFLCLPLLLQCQQKSTELPVMPAANAVDILALGDSYTKGEKVPWEQNFPNQLVDSLRILGYTAPSVRIIAQTGWRTDDLQAAIASAANKDLADSTFSLVTLCIGVNNQYQNADFDAYKVQFEQLLKLAIQRTGNRPSRVIVVSIPDWAYTTSGQNFPGEPSLISQEIDRYNAANKTISAQNGVHYANITDISRQGLAVPDLVASDGLHPSAKQYSAWLKIILPAVQDALQP